MDFSFSDGNCYLCRMMSEKEFAEAMSEAEKKLDELDKRRSELNAEIAKAESAARRIAEERAASIEAELGVPRGPVEVAARPGEYARLANSPDGTYRLKGWYDGVDINDALFFRPRLCKIKKDGTKSVRALPNWVVPTISEIIRIEPLVKKGGEK